MEIPDCYDPVFQEERRQAQWDREAQWPPKCGCCGEVLFPGRHYFEMDVMGDTLIVCDECKDRMEDSEVIVEDVSYGD